jgi:hypothetical protein
MNNPMQRYKRDMYEEGTDMSLENLEQFNQAQAQSQPRLLDHLLDAPSRKPSFIDGILPSPNGVPPLPMGMPQPVPGGMPLMQMAPPPRPPAQPRPRSVLKR